MGPNPDDFNSIDAELRKQIDTSEKMDEVMDKLFGRRNYVYDLAENVWLLPDIEYRGRGRRFLVLEMGLKCHYATLLDS